MNILVSSYYFAPELTPRAFRTNELVLELCRQHHKVKLFLPNKGCYNEQQSEASGLEIVYVGEPKAHHSFTKFDNTLNVAEVKSTKTKRLLKKLVPRSIKNQIKKFLEWHVNYFYPLRQKGYVRSLYEALKKEKEEFDIIISIGLPIETHIAAAIAFIRNKNLRRTPVRVAEYGDPFSKQKIRIFPLYRLIDHFIACSFKYISVPTQGAVSSFKSFKNKNKILLIPQAFDLTKYQTVTYTQNKIPTFSYAGCLYLKLRNPSVFLDYLSSLNVDFRFNLYTISESYDTGKIIEMYSSKLKGKLKVIHDTDREILISKLCKDDFLINFENSTSNQTPSKLIDYAIAGRPICTISTTDFNPKVFEEFLSGNYQNEININANDFDIKAIAKMFTDLHKAL